MTENEAIKQLEERIEYWDGEEDSVADYIETMKTAVSALKEIRQYREIGTVEDCRGAMKKQRGKSVIIETEDDREYEDLICPNCKTILHQRLKGIDDLFFKFKYCYWCGQKLDWG